MRARWAALAPGQRAALSSAAGAFAWSRALVWLVGIASILKTGFYDHVVSPGNLAPFDYLGNLLVGPGARWDSYWYESIAQHGYRLDGSAAFFPLYPALAHALGWVVGSSLFAGLLISFAALAGTLYLLHRLVELELGERHARAAVLVCAFFPMALFFSAVYTESLFLVLSVGAIYAARRERWWAAGLLGGLAAATRNTGVLVLVPLLVLYLWGPVRLAWRRPRWADLRPRAGVRPDAAWLALVGAGLGAVLAYMALAHGDWLASVHANQTHWHRHFDLLRAIPHGASAAWDGVERIFGGGPTGPIPLGSELSDPNVLAVVRVTDFAFLVYAAVALVGVARRLPAAYAAYALVSVVAAVSAPVGFEPLASLPRYVAGVFPLQIALSAWAVERRRLAVVLAACAVGLAYFEGQFATWRWVA